MKNIIAFILICISTLSFGQSVDCKSFKNGKFKIIDEDFGNSIITRKGSKQIEEGEGSRLKLEFKVKWIDDCTYTLELKKVLENPNKIELPEGMILKIEILETTENSYRQRTTSEQVEWVLESELIRIE